MSDDQHGPLIAEYHGGPDDGKRDLLLEAMQCPAPGCTHLIAPAWIAITPPDGFERDAEGAWVAHAWIGVYHLDHPEPVGGAYQYTWRDEPGQRA